MQMSSFISLILRGCIYVLSLPTQMHIAASSSYETLHAIRIKEYDSKKILQSEIHAFTNVTKSECCAACNREKYCLSFHFYPRMSTCVTLRELFEHVTVTSSAFPGYQLFQTDKPMATVDSDCELDVDCKSLSNSHCYNGSCTCDVGHRPDGNTCRNYTVACVSTPGYTWDAESDMCYRIETTMKRNWTDAGRMCATNKGRLIKPDTVTKNNKLRMLIEQTRSVFVADGFWIGIRYNSTADEWQWVDKTPVPAPPWAPGEPSSDDENCVDLLEKLHYEWNDRQCSHAQNYVCEIPLN